MDKQTAIQQLTDPGAVKQAVRSASPEAQEAILDGLIALAVIGAGEVGSRYYREEGIVIRAAEQMQAPRAAQCFSVV
jgi:hypothetical protein